MFWGENMIRIVYDGYNFPEFLRKIRVGLGLSQKEFSDIALEKGLSGFSYASIRNYEQGKAEPKYILDFIDGLKWAFENELNERDVIIIIDVK